MNLKGKQVPDDVLDSVLDRPDIFESMRIVLGPDGDKIGAKHMDRVEEAIKNEMKIHKKNCVNCTVSRLLWWPQKFNFIMAYQEHI